ncbi:hypothetical protein F8M49_30015 [Rhodococcus zopfii]|uniref:Uncharacterized protein n=1 Tax=Rhodococcus zopfii TaxID=43772 RepID=A0ABU3WJR5_9NOCA|nr:hypothetical protein [Rhodococcus zopfii]MDV2478598.1 hypothetical protein [Rhodococcus zopfii]
MTEPADWGDWLKPHMTGVCRPCGSCIRGLHHVCAWRTGAMHHGTGYDTHIGYLRWGTGPSSRYVGYEDCELHSIRILEKHGRRWRCTCECHRGGYLTPVDIPNAELALF